MRAQRRRGEPRRLVQVGELRKRCGIQATFEWNRSIISAIDTTGKHIDI